MSFTDILLSLVHGDIIQLLLIRLSEVERYFLYSCKDDQIICIQFSGEQTARKILIDHSVGAFQVIFLLNYGNSASSGEQRFSLPITGTPYERKRSSHRAAVVACNGSCPARAGHERANYIVVRCSNKDKGKEAGRICSASCIGCGICETNCTAEAIKVVENCAVIQEDACLSCGMCAVRCPRGAIADLRGIFT